MSKIYVRLTESELHELVREKAAQIIKEIGDTPLGQYHLGRLAGRKMQQDDDKGYDDVHSYAFDKRWNSDDYDPEGSEMDDAYEEGYEDQSAAERAHRDIRDHASIWNNVYGKGNR